jgi:hypothetical protein
MPPGRCASTAATTAKARRVSQQDACYSRTATTNAPERKAANPVAVVFSLFWLSLLLPWLMRLHFRAGSRFWHIEAKRHTAAVTSRPLWTSAVLQRSPRVDLHAFRMGPCRYTALTHSQARI